MGGDEVTYNPVNHWADASGPVNLGDHHGGSGSLEGPSWGAIISGVWVIPVEGMGTG